MGHGANIDDTRTNDDVDQVDEIHLGPAPVVSRELTMLATPFVRNGWGVAELERTYDEDENVVPAFREIGPDEAVIGLSVIKYRDPGDGWHYLVQTQMNLVDMSLREMKLTCMKLNDEYEAHAFVTHGGGRSYMWQRLSK